MAKNKISLDKPNGYDSLSPFGQNNDLNFRMKVESNQESYNSEVGFQKKLKPSTKGKGFRFNPRRGN